MEAEEQHHRGRKRCAEHERAGGKPCRFAEKGHGHRLLAIRRTISEDADQFAARQALPHQQHRIGRADFDDRVSQRRIQSFHQPTVGANVGAVHQDANWNRGLSAEGPKHFEAAEMGTQQNASSSLRQSCGDVLQPRDIDPEMPQPVGQQE